MPQALASKLGRPLPPGVALQVPGMTPTPEAAQYVLQSASAVTRVAVFAHGGRVYQALMTVQKDDPAAWEVFRTGLALEAAR
jgi:hypothetical protein